MGASSRGVAVGSMSSPGKIIRLSRGASRTQRRFADEKLLTEQRKAEEGLRCFEDRFHHFLDAVIDYAVFMLDAAGHVATWNEGAKRTKGYEADEIIGKHFSAFYTPEDRDAGKPERVLEMVRREGRFEEEGWRVRKDGSRFWADVVITALRNNEGKMTGFAKVTRDLTTRRQAEETERRLLQERAARRAAEESEGRLRESEDRYRALSRRLEVILEGVMDGITVQDRSGKVVFANSAAATVCGFRSVAELMEANPMDVVSRFEIRDERGQLLHTADLPGRRALAGEGQRSVSLHVRDKRDGREWWSLLRAGAVLGPEGDPELAINVWHDVTLERRQERQEKHLAAATAALATSLDHNEMFPTLARTLVPGLADWCAVHLVEGDELRTVAVAHTDRSKLAWARAYFDNYPSAPTEARGLWNVVRTGRSELYNDVSDAVLVEVARSPEHLATLRAMGIRAALIAPIKVRERTTGAISLVCTESARRYEPHDVAFVEELSRRAGAAIENAHLYQAAQEAASRAEAAARRAEEANRVKDEFLATVSHELRTPLNAIVGWAGLLKQKPMDASAAKGIEVIARNARAQVKIVEDILDVSRIIAGKLRIDPKPTDLVAIAREALDVVRPSASAKQIALELESQSDVCLLIGDSERLQQVIWNLLANAVKFTDRQGFVRVTIRRESSNIVLTVADNGKGIDASFLPFVFDPFKQADASTTRRFGGLGLGLALVRHIVELHGGSVGAESDGPGKGATFSVTLPVHAETPVTLREPSAAPRLDRSAPSNAGALHALRVLIVDDDPDARDMLETVLTEAGAIVEAAESAADGFTALRRFRPQVLVSDIGMPEEDGYSFVQRLRMLDPSEGGRIPSLALTAYTRGEDRTKALSAGFTTYIAKPVNPDDLVAAVANLAAFAPK